MEGIFSYICIWIRFLFGGSNFLFTPHLKLASPNHFNTHLNNNSERDFEALKELRRFQKLSYLGKKLRNTLNNLCPFTKKSECFPGWFFQFFPFVRFFFITEGLFGAEAYVTTFVSNNI